MLILSRCNPLVFGCDNLNSDLIVDLVYPMMAKLPFPLQRYCRSFIRI